MVFNTGAALLENTKDIARIFVFHAMSFMTTIGNYK